MARSRSNGLSGDTIDLYAFFYKNGEITEPSSIGDVKIKLRDSILTSIAASNIENLDSGIKKLVFDVPLDYEKEHYSDIWTGIVYESGDSAVSESFDFIIKDREWIASDSFSVPNYNIRIEDDNLKFKLYEKKWIKFNIKDANNNLNNTDRVHILFKDYGGSNVYLSSLTINDRLNSYYYFNSSKLKADYPSYIDRDNTYEWVFRIEYRNQVYQPDPVQFNFSET